MLEFRGDSGIAPFEYMLTRNSVTPASGPSGFVYQHWKIAVCGWRPDIEVLILLVD